MEYGTAGILADGIFSGKQPFNLMDEETEEQIMSSRGIFKNLRYILVTHCHNDHYNGSKILRFLENHPDATLVVPGNARLDEEKLALLGNRVIFLNTPAGKPVTLDFGQFKVQYMRVQHLTYRYPNHYCYNILAGDTNILLTADMDVERIDQLSAFARRKRSVGFFCHIFLWHRKWRKQLADLNCSELYFYHLPDEDRDRYGYRKKTLIYWKKYGKDLAKAKLLGD